MRARGSWPPADVCDRARALASLALDGELDEELGRVVLALHLSRCPECAARVAELRATAELVRSAALEPVSCRVPRHLAQARHSARRGQWSTAAAAVLAVVIGAAPFALVARAPGDVGPSLSSSSPPRLPLGQRSAGDDFAPSAPPVLGLR